jgi:hypothetical protein
MTHNVFITTGPLVLLASLELIRSKFSCGTYTNHVLVFQKKKPADDFAAKLDISRNTEIHFYTTGNVAQVVSSLMRFKRYLRKIETRGLATLFVGNCCHLATNYSALSAKQFNERNLIVEGIANYYSPDFRRCGSVRSRWAKLVLGQLIGLKYRRYGGHLSGADTGRFNAIYCFNPKGLVSNPGVVSVIPRMKNDDVRCSGEQVVMVVEQDVEDLLPKESAACVREAMFGYVEGLRQKGAKIYYKAVPAATKKPYSVPAEWNPVEDDNVPAELLIGKLGVTHCVSFCSSALMNAVDLFEGVTAAAFGLNLLEHEENRSVLLRLFNERGVKIVAL